MAFDRSSAVVVDFPLHGEWRALHTPAHRVPSHGTDYFGQRYAYDFAQFDTQGMPYSPETLFRHLTIGARVSRFYCWDQVVTAAFEGRVVGAGDGWADRRWVAVGWELIRATLFPPSIDATDYRPLAGNFVLVEGSPGVALYAHLRSQSLRVKVGDQIAAGDPVGAVGNSGNSTMPHLHFHVMDHVDPLRANGIPCLFRQYQRFAKDEWTLVECDAPQRLERIRTV